MVVHFIESSDVCQITFLQNENYITKHFLIVRHAKHSSVDERNPKIFSTNLETSFVFMVWSKCCPEQQVDAYMTSLSPFQSCDSHANEFKQKRNIGPKLRVSSEPESRKSYKIQMSVRDEVQREKQARS